MRTKTWIAIGLSVLIVASGGYWLKIRLGSKSSAAEKTSQPQTVVVQKGNLENTVSATGGLSMPHQAKLTFGTAGTVEKLEALEGTVVKKGQVIARLDGESLASLSLAVTQAEYNLKVSQRDLNKLITPDPPTVEQIADAEGAIRQAEAALERAKRELAIAQKNAPLTLESAAEQLYPTDTEVADAQGALKQAEAGLERAKRELAIAQRNGLISLDDTWTQLYNTPGIKNPGEKYELAKLQGENSLANAEANVAQAEETLRKARLRLSNFLTGDMVSSPDQRYEVSRLQSENSLANAHTAVAQAEETLRKSKVSLAKLKNPDPPKPEDVEIQQTRVKVGQDSLEQARQKLEKAAIKAPFDGVIATVPVMEGDPVGANTLIALLVDPSRLEMKAAVDELDILQVREGQEVIITLEALRTAPLRGQIRVIPPVATRQGGVVSYSITIELGVAQRVQLREGLTATATIVISKNEGILLVPNNAIKLDGRQRLVQVALPDGRIEDRPITTGQNNERWTEVTGGLAEGERIVVQATGTPRPPPGPLPRGLPGGVRPGVLPR